MIMAILVALILWATVKTANIYYPPNPESNHQLISRAQRLAKWRAEIDQMPDGYGKVQANRQWLKEVEMLINAAEAVDAPAQTPNIVNLYQLRKS